jgi:hypothetical protein
MDLNKDFKEFIALLNANGVEYLLVGGYAVGFYGYPRFTQDIDIWINPSEVNAEKILKTLNDFGFPIKRLSANDFLQPETIFQMGRPPFRIDIINSLDGVKFPNCYKRRISMTVKEIKIDIISIQDLRKNKKTVGRLKDLNDLNYLKKL